MTFGFGWKVSFVINKSCRCTHGLAQRAARVAVPPCPTCGAAPAPPVPSPAAGGFSSQTTVLMQKQRQLEHLERLLDDKRKEFVKRMRKCERLERLQASCGS